MYSNITQFEPLIPYPVPPALIEKAAEIASTSLRLTAAAHSSTRATLRELVRSMNSYYSNRIEGQGTHPRNIERALHKEFSDRPDIARLQRVALAHMAAERELEQQVLASLPALSSQFLLATHKTLYSRLTLEDRTTEDGHIIVPGELRQQDVEVGRHVPPIAASLPHFLARMDDVYNQPTSWDARLINIACQHHRAAWVHPFRDGNGRSVRLQTHCALWSLSEGLWSPSRGLARSVNEYYAKLHNADMPRHGDLDGRGNLTTAGFIEWIDYFLTICRDQVNFMNKMLDLDGMKRRIEALVIFRATENKGFRSEAVLPLFHVFAAGPVSRAEFAQLTSLGERTSRTLLSHLLSVGLLLSDTPLGPVRFGLPLDSLQFLFPELYPEAATTPDW